jgi:hypothetical protein
MKQRFSERLDALENRTAKHQYANGLREFYRLPDEERLNRTAHLYGKPPFDIGADDEDLPNED